MLFAANQLNEQQVVHDLLNRAVQEVSQGNTQTTMKLLLKPEFLQAFGSGASGPDR